MRQEGLIKKRTKIIFTQNWYVVNLGIMSLSAVLKQHGFETDMAMGSQEAILKKIKDEAHMEVWLDPVLLYAHDANLENVVYYLAGAFPYFAAAQYSQ